VETIIELTLRISSSGYLLCNQQVHDTGDLAPTTALPKTLGPFNNAHKFPTSLGTELQTTVPVLALRLDMKLTFPLVQVLLQIQLDSLLLG
jgi:hypothetical protein